MVVQLTREGNLRGASMHKKGLAFLFCTTCLSLPHRGRYLTQQQKTAKQEQS
jgi:hypothetical protein